MATDTPLSYRSLVIYEIYVRNHGPHGNFADVTVDLERIRSLGVDIVWFMPIHPIGSKNKKGSLGCPYSIADYREVNPEYGNKADFSLLIERAHALGMKVMIDVVYNHTAHDSVLVHAHPEWFHQDANGIPVTTVPDWSDVIDLKHPNPALSQYLIETLQYWASFGVDGFRCDVASLLPEDFWVAARQAVAQVKPGVIWLAESVHAAFVGGRRAAGLTAISDSEVYRGFDLTYDYDIWPIFHSVVLGRAPVARYLEMLRFQDCIYPANYVKMRCVENHDQPRIMKIAPSRSQAMAWTAFQAFNKGALLIYAGEEAGAVHTPSLFNIDKIEWDGYPLQSFLTALALLKKDPVMTQGVLAFLEAEPAIQAAWVGPSGNLFGIFNVAGKNGTIGTSLPDGAYTNNITGEAFKVTAGKIPLPETAAICRFQLPEKLPKLLYSDLLDYNYRAE